MSDNKDSNSNSCMNTNNTWNEFLLFILTPPDMLLTFGILIRYVTYNFLLLLCKQSYICAQRLMLLSEMMHTIHMLSCPLLSCKMKEKKEPSSFTQCYTSQCWLVLYMYTCDLAHTTLLWDHCTAMTWLVGYMIQ